MKCLSIVYRWWFQWLDKLNNAVLLQLELDRSTKHFSQLVTRYEWDTVETAKFVSHFCSNFLAELCSFRTWKILQSSDDMDELLFKVQIIWTNFAIMNWKVRTSVPKYSVVKIRIEWLVVFVSHWYVCTSFAWRVFCFFFWLLAMYPLKNSSNLSFV